MMSSICNNCNTHGLIQLAYSALFTSQYHGDFFVVIIMQSTSPSLSLSSQGPSQLVLFFCTFTHGRMALHPNKTIAATGQVAGHDKDEGKVNLGGGREGERERERERVCVAGALLQGW